MLRIRLAERYALATVNLQLAALRGVMKACWQLGLIDADTHMRLQDVKRVRGHRAPRGRMLDLDEQRALFAACANDPLPAGARDAAALSLMLGAGLRRGEAQALPRAAIDLEHRTVRVLGKGRKERIVPLPDFVVAALRPWLDIMDTHAGTALFVRCNGEQLGQPLVRNGDTFGNVLAKRSAQAGIAPCTPHDLRRTYISGLLLAEVDTFLVQRLAGHASPITTALYDRRADDHLRAAVDRLASPVAGVGFGGDL